MSRLVSVLFSVILFAAPGRSQEVDAGRKAFEIRCAGCHGADGHGGELGPNIVDLRSRGSLGRLRANLRDVIRNGIPDGVAFGASQECM
jgi:cytochrome c oxidase cbb3-type subunit 3